MTWPKIILIAWFALGALVTIAQIGKPRRPLEPAAAVATTVAAAGIIALVVIA